MQCEHIFLYFFSFIKTDFFNQLDQLKSISNPLVENSLSSVAEVTEQLRFQIRHSIDLQTIVDTFEFIWKAHRSVRSRGSDGFPLPTCFTQSN